MRETTVTLTTADGECPVHVFAPDDGAKHPGVIMYTDAFGIRPASLAMGRRLAEHGYVVLVPDVFYRIGEYGPFDPEAVFAGENPMATLAPMLAATDTHRAALDSSAFLDYLASRADVSGTEVGVTGYCMGGALALTVAGTYPDRVGAAAAFHTGRIVGESELSPSRVIPNIRGRVYVAGADRDPGYPPHMAKDLDRLLTDAGVDHRLEIYPDAKHGFTQPDSAVYDEASAERHWRELFALFDETLKADA
ncbi:dienelactone hydrolase family protein [Agromyces protaetiae]|uniref:Dienelactone hydrolase family protein n=1 Tax=Agromyces protaetiae TaxID=2509455 RepID=A0A4P6FCW6_9MICO|nr:dienelactone hydrolase family protein [Agromyces protaetiae]QAY73744.1 dienelactone hydrolase family protein [Agromyces protaetiae]